MISHGGDKIMSDILTPQKHLTLTIDDEHEHELIAKIARALSVKERVMILKNILTCSKNIPTISKELNIPESSVTRHVDVLADAGLIYISYQPGIKGHSKYLSQAILDISVSLQPLQKEIAENEYSLEMPLGMFADCNVKAPCGMTGKEKAIETFDDPSIFFSSSRIEAECIWFNSGFIAYRFPAKHIKNHPHKKLSFTFEICSETIYYNNDWPSDITVRINDIELLTFESKGDFGGRRGKYTPTYWPVTSTQFGLLHKVSVTDEGVFFDHHLYSDKIRLADLKLNEHNAVKFEIGVKEDAVHCGGLNLFGKNFGDFPQAIIMTLKW